MSLASVLSALAHARRLQRRGAAVSGLVIGFLAAVAGAGLVGFINGVIIAKLKVPAFIVTLGTSFIVRGVALLMVGEHDRHRAAGRASAPTATRR